MKYLVVAKGLHFWKAKSNDKNKFENMRPTMQDNQLSA